MLLELLFIFAIFNTDYTELKYSETQQRGEIVEFGDCDQLPHQKTLDRD